MVTPRATHQHLQAMLPGRMMMASVAQSQNTVGDMAAAMRVHTPARERPRQMMAGEDTV